MRRSSRAVSAFRVRTSHPAVKLCLHPMVPLPRSGSVMHNGHSTGNRRSPSFERTYSRAQLRQNGCRHGAKRADRAVRRSSWQILQRKLPGSASWSSSMLWRRCRAPRFAHKRSAALWRAADLRNRARISSKKDRMVTIVMISSGQKMVSEKRMLMRRHRWFSRALKGYHKRAYGINHARARWGIKRVQCDLDACLHYCGESETWAWIQIGETYLHLLMLLSPVSIPAYTNQPPNVKVLLHAEEVSTGHMSRDAQVGRLTCRRPFARTTVFGVR